VTFDRKVDGQPYGGRPDGAAVDVEGNYWVAMYGGACVLQLTSGQVPAAHCSTSTVPDDGVLRR
jgi:sugar lactone lactonase YvrE